MCASNWACRAGTRADEGAGPMPGNQFLCKSYFSLVICTETGHMESSGILDEIQRLPVLLSFIQGIVDEMGGFDSFWGVRGNCAIRSNYTRTIFSCRKGWLYTYLAFSRRKSRTTFPCLPNLQNSFPV